MKKLVMLGAVALLSACPVACINDPTLSDEVPTDWQTTTDTDTDVLTDEEKAKLDELLEESNNTETVTETATSTSVQ